MTWLDVLTLELYVLVLIDVSTGWPPLVEAFNRVIITLQEVAS